MQSAVRLTALALAALIEQVLSVMAGTAMPALHAAADRLRSVASHEPRPGDQLAHDLGVSGGSLGAARSSGTLHPAPSCRLSCRTPTACSSPLHHSSLQTQFRADTLRHTMAGLFAPDQAIRAAECLSVQDVHVQVQSTRAARQLGRVAPVFLELAQAAGALAAFEQGQGLLPMLFLQLGFLSPDGRVSTAALRLALALGRNWD